MISIQDDVLENIVCQMSAILLRPHCVKLFSFPGLTWLISLHQEMAMISQAMMAVW